LQHLLSASRKDKTLLEILDRLKKIESKIDRAYTGDPIPSEFGPAQPSPAIHPAFRSEGNEPIGNLAPTLRSFQQLRLSGIGRNQPYRHTSAAHKMLTWPAMQQLLQQSSQSSLDELKGLEQEGSAFIVRMQEGTPELPWDEALPEIPFVGMQTQETRSLGGARFIFPAPSWDTMRDLAIAYFDTFNLIHPFLDREDFFCDTLSRLHTEGFDDDADSIIALLVFGLGEVAIEGSRGSPIEVHNGRPSGVRGGTALRPPGLVYFNEARKHIGFVLTGCELENVQILSLAAYVCLILVRLSHNGMRSKTHSSLQAILRSVFSSCSKYSFRGR
jgi:hypothetical protein